jgi:ATP-dependent DNA ligase
VPPLFALSPSTSDPAVARQWLNWTAAGVEGLVFKRLDQPYLPGRRRWLKWKIRESTRAIIGAVTGTLTRPGALLLGRLDEAGRLHYLGRTTPLNTEQTRELAPLLAPANLGHPWQDRVFTAGWGSRETLETTTVAPEVIAEISADTAADTTGRWRHPVPRPDLTPADLPKFCVT